MAATNELGQSSFSEYGTFRTGVAGVETPIEPELDWLKGGINPTTGKLQYINAATGAVRDSRPAEMDGPIDPLLGFKKKRYRLLKEMLKDAPSSLESAMRLTMPRGAAMLQRSRGALLRASMKELRGRIKASVCG